jgi:hypothetical protein
MLQGLLRFSSSPLTRLTGCYLWDAGLCCGAILSQQPLVFVIGITLIEVVVFGHCLYILEREAQPELFTFGICVWLALQALLTGMYARSIGQSIKSPNIAFHRTATT